MTKNLEKVHAKNICIDKIVATFNAVVSMEFMVGLLALVCKSPQGILSTIYGFSNILLIFLDFKAFY